MVSSPGAFDAALFQHVPDAGAGVHERRGLADAPAEQRKTAAFALPG
jgi:hypothetical protein